ncbi:MAG: hypothetical protein KDC43_27450 [Saprospiraceae bacterium]|nr:hypothetical protein [Saprospiraceae bacterium]
MKSCLHLLAATALCMIAAQTATAVQAKTMIIGLDMSGSNDLVTVPEHAANVADVIDRQIKKMDLGDRVVVGLLGAYGHSDNMKRLDITMSRKKRPEKVGASLGKLIQGIPGLVASGELDTQPNTNLLGFLEDEAFLLDCQNNPAQFILITDGVESSHEVDGNAIIEGKAELPAPRTTSLAGCDLTILGIGQWVSGANRTVRDRLILAWQKWAKTAGIGHFKAIPKIADYQG